MLSTELAVTALVRALALYRPEVHHSDQGVQYAAEGYIDRLEAVDAQISEDVYQTERIHSALGYLTPVEFEMLYWTGMAA